MEKVTISAQIEKELNIVRKTKIEINPNYAPTHTDLLELINLYSNSKYRGSDNDTEGFKRWFMNISDYRCKTASKSFDIDTKDILLLAEPGQSEHPVWFMSKELKTYMKETHWAQLLNDIKRELPRWGSVVVKKVGNEVGIVNLLNFFPSPKSATLKIAPFIIEQHPYSIGEFEEIAKKLKWDNVKEALALFKKFDEITVNERYGRWEDEFKRSLVVNRNSKEIILDQVKVDEIPYKELHYDKRLDRWIAKGVVEDLFENQIAGNETTNFKRKNMYWGSKFLFQTKDETVAAKMLTDMVSGRVIPSKETINRIDMREQNLAAFQVEENTWEKNADNKTFAHDIMRGQQMKSGTPLGLGRLQANMALGYYDGIRENYAIFLKDILFDWVLPEFKKKKQKEHILNIVGDASGIEKFDRMMIGVKLSSEVIKYVFKHKQVPNAMQIETMKGVLSENQKSKERSVNLPKGFYDNLKVKMDIHIVGESIDLDRKIRATQYVLSLIASNPMILVNPQTKKAFFKILSLTGINPEEFETETDMPNLMDIMAKENVRSSTAPAVPVAAPTASMPEGGAVPVK